MNKEEIEIEVPNGCTFSKQADSPCPLYVLGGACAIESPQVTKFLHLNIFGRWFRRGEMDMLNDSPYLVRWVRFDRLPIILETGIDVEPADKVLWALNTISSDESYRVGGDEKILLVLNPECLRRSWQIVPAAMPTEELTALRRDYSTAFPSEDGETLWLSRVSTEEHGIHPYEEQCGFWIPGSPWDALQAIYILGPDYDSLVVRIQQMIRECAAKQWG